MTSLQRQVPPRASEPWAGALRGLRSAGWALPVPPPSGDDTGQRCVGGCRALPDHASRGQAHIRVSYMIDAGRQRQGALNLYGHASISITLDRYGHLMPGNEDEAAELLDSYLGRANTKARLAQIGGAA